MLSRSLRVVATTSAVATRRGTRHGVPGKGTRRGGIASLSQDEPSERSSGRRIEDVVVPLKLPILRRAVGADNIGQELAGSLEKREMNKLLLAFSAKPPIRTAALEQGLSDKLFHKAFVEFRIYCQESSPLPPELHIKFSDILQGKAVVDDLFPFFLEHARRVFPHLECLEDLRSISDLTNPHSWYVEARNMQRKIIFHAGPTNSGKTHSALERFTAAKTGVYCGPLKLLASEVFHKTNELGVPCDMKTGDDRKFASGDGEAPAQHVACTVEMLDTAKPFEVAIIDEIQMVRDMQRGWAWTRALLGVCAEEVHLCGEAAAIELIRELLFPIGEELEVKQYKRMTPLRLQTKAVGNFSSIRDGDCVVCFNKKDIFNVSRKIETTGRQVAVVYGSLPPATKLAQAARFNNPSDPCKVIVATDAIGMGLNLHIRRVIFYSLLKPKLVPGDEGLETQIEPLADYEAKQIGGRAGRFGTSFEAGEVTTFRNEDLKLLTKIWNQQIEEVEQAGLRPTLEQIEMFSFHLPQATLTNLLHIFMSLVSVNDSSYFLCGMEDTLFLSNMIEHVPLPLRARYTFCLAPVNRKQAKVCTMFLKFARRFSRNEPATFQWFCGEIGWPLRAPERLVDLMELESVFDMMELYLWLTFRFPDAFPNATEVREVQTELDFIIQEGVANIVTLMKASESPSSSGVGLVGGGMRSRQSQRDRRALMDTILPLSETELDLEAELRRKECNLVLRLTQAALQGNAEGAKLDIRETANILETMARELEDRSDEEFRAYKFPAKATIRRCLTKKWISNGDLATMTSSYKKERKILNQEHSLAVSVAAKANRQSSKPD